MTTLEVTDVVPVSEANPFSLEAYDYELPRHLIAAYPLERRDASRMLVLDKHSGLITDSQFSALPNWLREGDLLVLNNAKVSPVRLLGHRAGHTGKVEIFLLAPVASGSSDAHWHALLRPARKLPPDTIVEIPHPSGDASAPPLAVRITSNLEKGEGTVALLLEAHKLLIAENATADLLTAVLDVYGAMPLPPYMQRSAEALDKQRYQTIYSKAPGAQAAPTAGLHFSEQTFIDLAAKGIQTAEVTLNVGAGTFRGVTHTDIRQHNLHSEYYQLPAETVERIRHTKQRGGRVIAVGTTSVRTLETAARNQGGLPRQAETGSSELFIYPGFTFQVVDAMLTNFHLPQSSLLMLVSAMAGRDAVLNAYRHAIEAEYRFYSYGDCMLIQ